jgi:hypothetical protein
MFDKVFYESPFDKMRYLIYKSPGGRSEYLFKTNNKKRVGRQRKTDCYYATVIKIFQGIDKRWAWEGSSSWPSVKQCRELTDLEFVTYRLLGYIGPDHEKRTEEIPRNDVQAEDATVESTTETLESNKVEESL